MSDLSAVEMLERVETCMDRLQQLLNTGLQPRDLSDPDKLRLQAAIHDANDIKRGVYDRTEVQDDLRCIADLLEAME